MRIGEHTGISPLTKKQVMLKNSSVADHLLFCSHSASNDYFTGLSFLLKSPKKQILLKSPKKQILLKSPNKEEQNS